MLECACCERRKRWRQRRDQLYFRGGCNGPTRGWRGPIWQFYPRKRANIHTASRPGAVDAGTPDDPTCAGAGAQEDG